MMWLARDKNGNIALYLRQKPRLNAYHDAWITDEEDMVNNEYCPPWLMLQTHLFPEVTWENSPQEVEIVIKNPLPI